MTRFDGEKLKQLRLDLGMSQEELAKRLGIDARTYRRYESCEVNEGDRFEIRSAPRRALLRRMCLELGLQGEQELIVGAPPARLARVLLRAEHFVGRQELLVEVEAFCRGGSGVLALVAPGGSGKTALVERALRGIEGAYVHSFYDDPRTEEVLDALQGEAHALVVLDGLEVAQSEGRGGRALGEIEDPALRRMLRAVASGALPRRVLATSRLPLVDLAAWEGLTTLDVPPLTWPQSVELLQASGVVGDERALQELWSRTGGHALSVAALGAYVGRVLGGDPARAHLVDIGSVSGDDPVARRLASVLRAYEGALSREERQILGLLSLFSGRADRDLLAAASELDALSYARGVARLARLGLVDPRGGGLSAHPFVREHFRGLLAGAEREAHERLMGLHAARLQGRPSLAVREPSDLDRVEELLWHTIAAGHVEEAWGLYQRALGGFESLGLLLGEMARGLRALASFSARKDPLVLPEALRGERRARLLYDWGLYALALGDLPLVRRCRVAYERALDDVQPDVARNLRITGLRTAAYAEWLAGDSAHSRSLLRQASDRIAPDDPPFHRVRNIALLAMIASDEGRQEEALGLLRELFALEAAPAARRALWAAEILSRSGLDGEARALAERAVLECEDLGWLGHVAHGTSLLGHLALPGDRSAARRHLERASSWAEASREVEVRLRCHALGAAIEAAEGAQSPMQARLGRALAEEHGMRRFLRYSFLGCSV